MDSTPRLLDKRWRLPVIGFRRCVAIPYLSPAGTNHTEQCGEGIDNVTTVAGNPDVLEKLVSLCKRRGFIFQSSEIYGGTGSVWDYGPLGVELKKNIKDRWWDAMVRARDDIEGLDAAILMHPRVWEASGHVSGFVDPLVDCRNCKRRFRADDPQIKGTPGTPEAQCPSCGMKGTLGEPRQFNLMFRTFMGPVEDSAATVYLRPETAQGIYVNLSLIHI